MSEGLVEVRETEKEWKNPDVRSKYRAIITPHYLRHNYITRCWEAEIDPMITMRIVGHSDYRTTANIYTHLQEEHLEKTKKRLDAIFAGKKVAQLENGWGLRKKRKPSKTACFQGFLGGTADASKSELFPSATAVFTSLRVTVFVPSL